jgi:capsular exopolysaccharide synthesis family protein
VILSLIGAYIYLRYTTTLYESKATIIIKEDLDRSSELSPFAELGGFFSRYRNNEIENELAIFRSKRLITEVVEELELNILYESIGAIKTSELYEYKPLVVQFLSFKDSTNNKPIPKLFFEIQSDTRFKIENESETLQEEYDFGELVSLPFGDIIVIPSLDNPDKFEHYIGKNISVLYRPIDKMSQVFQNRIKVNNDLKNSKVVELKMQSAVTQKSEDFIDELIFQYNKDAINDRNQVAQKTSNFIDSRLDIITQELDSVERNKVQFKSSNRLTNIEAEAQLILENASEFNKRQFDVSTQLELANTMIDYMENTSSNDLLPANIGLDGEEIGETVNNYNSLILQRNKLLKSSTAKNPVVVNLNNQIALFRNTILESLKNTSNALKISMRDLNYKESMLNSKITGVPAKEKIYRDIERQQIIKEQLYLFLLQQREEANISLAVTAPKAKIVDRAYSSNVPVYPKKALIYLGAFLAGLLIPFIFIYIRLLLNTKVTNRRDLERVFSDLSIIGEIPKIKNGDNDSVSINDRSILAESFRILRTNLQYLFINKLNSGSDAHTVFVTSSIKGEGKTFVAYNLALTLALTGKKVVLVGADIRNPQLHRYLPDELSKAKGLTNYIIDSKLNLSEIVEQSEQNEHLKIILSGDIPPNPAELLMQSRTKNLFDELNESFDYVIVDTAPSVLVTDTILINKLADVTLYVIRAGFTEKKLLDFPKEAIGDGRMSNVALVLNHVDINNFGYGNKYGYSYTKEKTPFYKRIFG